jgi:hypothetical protein
VGQPSVGIVTQCRIAEQRGWIEAHGGSCAGYVRTNGSAADADCDGDGGEAIYDADVDALRRLIVRAHSGVLTEKVPGAGDV